jgi:hypothetical protein
MKCYMVTVLGNSNAHPKSELQFFVGATSELLFKDRIDEALLNPFYFLVVEAFRD